MVFMVVLAMDSDRVKNWPKNERPRERLLAEGAEKVSDADLLAIVLRVGKGTFKKGVQGQNVSAFARSLIAQFGSLRALDRARIQDLLKVPGLGPAKVAQLKAAIEIGKRVCAKRLVAKSFDSSEAIAKHFRPRFVGRRQESVIAVLLNGQNQVLGEKKITEGTPTQAIVYVRSILEEALHLSAAAVVLVHNHPSGCPEPSAGDDETTRDLRNACKLIGLVLLDHIIVGDKTHYSYADEGRLDDSASK
ncbi:MAG TPA: DNA repair protein RadC [Candidatus Latescibacteria bacterium]|jgi:DNA repair protein RadC|nr:DNA repair protein RadC [Candidatus Latescibacterota bacterium]HOS66253.1 DNA repair protein RadC [Candidatus Latescibacterota bacterium]